ncbi:hypothetical protein C8A01DRAFT_42175 [Parachaetomium inaequale]|uniref:Fungal lipase-type domain-containing protein n=1 Tax=Parachaetomium inaequale TaxID=2588326 RepID=A0AAN6SKV5_9PEZI|nr:hypothetical protein C8A01DRAFT_42175 [Parachaetomium inaequale]
MEDEDKATPKPNLLGRVFKRHSVFPAKAVHVSGAVAGSVAGGVASTSVGLSVGLSGGSAGLLRSDNSAAMSRNIREASIELDKHLREIDSAEKESLSTDVISMSRWIEKQEAYANSSFPFSVLPEVTLPTADISNYDAWTMMADHLSMPLRVHLTVVAIRGTASIHDWMVNLNPGSCSDSPVEDKDEFLGKDKNGDNYHAHAGFLASAKEMLLRVCEEIAKAVNDFRNSRTQAVSGGLQLVFTGHSAGGAVAAMLYAHFMKPQAATSTELRFLNGVENRLHPSHQGSLG